MLWPRWSRKRCCDGDGRKADRERTPAEVLAETKAARKAERDSTKALAAARKKLAELIADPSKLVW